MHRTPHHWLFTVAAVFLLLFTAVDLAYPAMCAEDGGVDPVVISRGSSATATLTASASETRGDAPAGSDDCFCCCEHVIAAAVFHVAVPEGSASTRFALTADRVTVAPPVAFHPPRLA
jgi:hypothetical protein